MRSGRRTLQNCVRYLTTALKYRIGKSVCCYHLLVFIYEASVSIITNHQLMVLSDRPCNKACTSKRNVNGLCQEEGSSPQSTLYVYGKHSVIPYCTAVFLQNVLYTV